MPLPLCAPRIGLAPEANDLLAMIHTILKRPQVIKSFNLIYACNVCHVQASVSTMA